MQKINTQAIKPNIGSKKVLLSDGVNPPAWSEVDYEHLTTELKVKVDQVGTGTVGPEGPMGPQGIEGPRGLQGLQGVAGPKGDVGPIGPKGDIGPTGPQGVAGSKGDKGDTGTGLVNRGNWITATTYNPGDYVFSRSIASASVTSMWILQGDTAYVSNTSPHVDTSKWIEFQAPKGEQGIQGPQGPQGSIGATGPTGPKGDQGLKGDQGVAGPQGIQGPQGATGNTGAQGVKGDIGPIGPVGPIGPQGTKGDTGTGLVNKGAWVTGTTYNPGDYVFDRSTSNASVNSMWILQGTTYTSSTSPYLDTTKWVEFQAPQGPQGIQGVQGPKGDKGDQGVQGIQGLKGDTGSQGIQGVKGDTGATGSIGPVGATGAQGIQGIQGVAGINGSTGPKGDKGDKGDTGTGLTNRGEWVSGTTYVSGDYVFSRSTSNATVNSMWILQGGSYVSNTLPYQDLTYWVEFQAPTGPQGIQGAVGPKGDTGAVGPQGIQGLTGSQGPKGDTGATGATGSQGATGLQGPQGLKGDKGDKGDTGLAGSQGIQGLQGPIGNTGPAGVRGDKGDKGDQGFQGPNGINGKQVELQKGSTHIQWRYVGDTAWINIVDLASLKGESTPNVHYCQLDFKSDALIAQIAFDKKVTVNSCENVENCPSFTYRVRTAGFANGTDRSNLVDVNADIQALPIGTKYMLMVFIPSITGSATAILKATE